MKYKLRNIYVHALRRLAASHYVKDLRELIFITLKNCRQSIQLKNSTLI